MSRRGEAVELRTVGDDGRHRMMGKRVGSALDWTVTLSGEIERPCSFSLSELWTFPIETRSMDITCVSSGKIVRPKQADVVFSGVNLMTLIRHVGLKCDAQGRPLARTVRWISRAPGSCGPQSELHSTSIDLHAILRGETPVLLTGILNDKPLPYRNGGPLRSVVWGTYFYKSIKWLSEIAFLQEPVEEAKGTWERHAGYHPKGGLNDPKFSAFFSIQSEQESWSMHGEDAQDAHIQMKDKMQTCLERGDLTDCTAARVEVFYKDFAQHPQWNAKLSFARSNEAGDVRAASLRGTRMNRLDLRGWDLAHANFSLSFFIGTQLANADGSQAASMRHCDLEGAVLWGATLCGVDMRDAYLGGVSFCKENGSMPAHVKGLRLEGAGGLDEETAQWLEKNGAIGVRASAPAALCDEGDLLPCRNVLLYASTPALQRIASWLRLHTSCVASWQQMIVSTACLQVWIPIQHQELWLYQIYPELHRWAQGQGLECIHEMRDAIHWNYTSF